MSAPLWVVELAAEFWQIAGDPGAYPRDLNPAARRAMLLSVKILADLSVRRVRDWLQRQQVVCDVPVADRALRACLFARDGWGFIFLDAADAVAEHRFSLAHELGHFLRHYWQPRRRAVVRFGEGILDVFDGKRPPTTAERLHALLRGVPVGAHWHLLGRDDHRRITSPAIAASEDEADQLAYELLAPAAAVAVLRSGADLMALLQATFGLPPAQAAAYAEFLAPEPVHDPLLERLRK